MQTEPIPNLKALIKLAIERGEYPKYIYKYYDSREQYFLDMIEESYIYFNNPSEFNDPFDYHIPIITDATQEEYEAFLRQVSTEPKTDEEIRIRAKELCANPADTYEYINRLVYELLYKDGVACFSNTNNNVLLWSHYANKHRGICIEYDLEKVVEEHMYPMPVIYGDLPKFNYITDSRRNATASNLARYKSTHWKHEEELRIISQIQGKNFISKDCVNAVITGCRYPDPFAIKQLFAVNGYNASFQRAGLRVMEYAMDIIPD
jgi:Protein of unknown function (DUF2971)